MTTRAVRSVGKGAGRTAEPPQRRRDLPAPPRPEDERSAFRALGSGIRMEILTALAARDRTVAELAKGLRLHPATLRYHLGLLMGQKLVEEVVPASTGRRGRPAARYRVSRRGSVGGYPPRHFEIVAQASLETLVESVGEDAAVRELRRKGTQTGRMVIESVADRKGDAPWGPETFGRVVVNGLFRDFGTESEILAVNHRYLTFRAFTCPFLELAERLPRLICDALDVGFHDGIDLAVGARTERIACMGHGGAFCEYRMTWGSGHGAPSGGGPAKEEVPTDDGKGSSEEV